MLRYPAPFYPDRTVLHVREHKRSLCEPVPRKPRGIIVEMIIVRSPWPHEVAEILWTSSPEACLAS